MNRYAIIDPAAGRVVNVVEYDTAPSNPPPGFPENHLAVPSDRADTTWTWDGSQLVAPPAPPAPPVDLKAAAASSRYAKETGGITVNGVPVATDRESQAMINGAYSSAIRDSTWTTQWKSETGFVSLTAAQLIAIAIAVSMHVNACFGKEADVDAQITAGTITTVDQITAAFAALNTAYTT